MFFNFVSDTLFSYEVTGHNHKKENNWSYNTVKDFSFAHENTFLVAAGRRDRCLRLCKNQKQKYSSSWNLFDVSLRQRQTRAKAKTLNAVAVKTRIGH